MKWLWVSMVVLLLDQCTKLLADAMLVLHQQVTLIPFLALFKAYNPGAAFSFLSDASGWQRWFFVVLALVVIVILLVWLLRLPAAEKATSLALALILGGAAGNLIDRLVYGYVIDFIDVYYGSWHWPAFNVADAAISVGAFLLLLDAFRGGREKSPAA
ncbi:MAG: signal peptidase II [Gammaproteobacteria bacterium]|nr:signal peptidase II [Gammaproteobacteria bacterium]MDH3935659.1 signal peptidase II [Gammaproteobacteria bacterium]MDH3971998.1 signal peptidase II [Gammaproteobacteria bacterium]